MEGQPDHSESQEQRPLNHHGRSDRADSVPAGAAPEPAPETPPTPSPKPSPDASPDLAPSGGQRSPIRPNRSADEVPRKPRLVPARPPDTRPFEGEQGEPLSKVETVELSPQQALDRLRAQMAQIAEEYAAGRLNRAQFYAIYSRYNEQRAVTEGLMARDPHSTAWQQVVRPGHTAFLRQHFEARILSFAIYDLGQTTPIVRHGTVHPRLGEVDPILSALPGFMRRKKQALGPARKAVSGGHWLVVVPGQYTVTMVLFSLEPSAQQITQIADLAGDFERANLRALARGDRDPARLVFPQRALFEKSSS